MPGSNNRVQFANGYRLEASAAEEWQLMQATGTDVSCVNNAGNPEGVVPANMGSICHDRTNGNIYVKHTGTNAFGWVLVSTGGSTATDSFAMQTGTSPVIPDNTGLVTFNGSRVASGTNPVRTNGTAANTMQLEVQTSQAIAATDATKVGLATFDSAGFDVDANGFVTLNNIPNPATTSIVFDDFIYNDTDQQNARQNIWGPFGVFNSGGGWSSANVVNHPGVLKLTSTTTGFEYLLGSAGDAGWGPAAGLYDYTFEWMMKIDTLSSANPNYTLYLGCMDNAAGAIAAAHGYWFQYNHAVNSGNWQMVCQGAATTTANSNTAADTNWHRFKININSAGTSVAFYIDGVQLTNSPITTNITTNRCSPEMLCNTTAGINQKSFNYDYFYSKFIFTR